MAAVLRVLGVVVPLLAILVYRFLTPIPCHEEALVIGNDTIDVCAVFSSTYDEARERFRTAAEVAGATSHALTIVEDYTMDLAVLPGTWPGLVVHTSGVHGVEGYAGSAIQVAWLQQFAQSFSPRPTIVLVHAFNPSGMAGYRRVNENNVDLNRNGIRSPEDWQDVKESHYNRAAYEALDDVLNPSMAPTLWNAYVLFIPKLLLKVWQHSIPTLKAAMVGGQYHRPTGVFYGGDQVQASYLGLEAWLTDYLASHDEIQLSSTTWMDVHTGLGPLGVDTLLPGDNFRTASENPTAYGQLLEQWFHGSRNEFLAGQASVAKGYENIKGGLGEYFKGILPSALFVVQEFGTRSLPVVGHALMVENAAFHYLPPDEAKQWAQRTLRPAFYPASPEWRRRILENGLRFLNQGVARSAMLSQPNE